MNITNGKMKRAQKVVIYGPEGIGKTSLAAQFPDALIIDTEHGTDSYNVRRIECPESWEELLAVVKEVAESNVCKTLVIDTADWAEHLAIEKVLRDYKVTSIEAISYGKGFTYLGEEFLKLLTALDGVIASGKNVVITAHAKMRKFEQPDELGAYDRWEMKLSRQVAPLLKEWSDMLLFLTYKTYIVTSENNTKKGQGGKRVIYTSHNVCWDAKNRLGLPPEMELSYKSLAPTFESTDALAVSIAPEGETPVKTARSKVYGLIKDAGISE